MFQFGNLDNFRQQDWKHTEPSAPLDSKWMVDVLKLFLSSDLAVFDSHETERLFVGPSANVQGIPNLIFREEFHIFAGQTRSFTPQSLLKPAKRSNSSESRSSCFSNV